MSIIEKLKWFWDPRTEEEKRYKADPLRRYTQEVRVFVNNIEEPFERVLEFEDQEISGWIFRANFKRDMRDWLNRRGEKGIRIDDVWYPPAMIERIELGEHTAEEIQ
jgi:hypothetical protein